MNKSVGIIRTQMGAYSFIETYRKVILCLPLLIGRDSFFILDLLLYVFNGIAGFYFQSDCLSSQGFNKDLHSSSQSEYQMEGGFFLDVIIGKGSSVF